MNNLRALLEIQNLKTFFKIKKGFFNGDSEIVKAIDGVNLTVYEGDVVGIVGESGAGKSTLAHTIMGLYPEYSGKILFDGELVETKQDFKKFRQDVQLIFQDFLGALNPRFTVYQTILEPLKLRKILKQHLKEEVYVLLEKVGLSNQIENRYPHSLSGGQKQRIQIARSLALNPKLLICDEITSALDVSIQTQIINLLLELKQKYQISFLVITHDLSLVRYFSNRVVVMHQGKVVEVGNTEQVLFSPKHSYTQKLVNSIPIIDMEF